MTDRADQSFDFRALYSRVFYNTTSHYSSDIGQYSNKSHGHQIWDYEVLLRANYNDSLISNGTNETGIWDAEMPNVDEFRPMFTAIYIIVFLCSLFGNLIVLIVIARNYKARAVANLFLANLAVADLFQSIGCIIPTLVVYVVANYWVFGEVLCRCLSFLQLFGHTSSISLLTGISIERYYVIVYPIRSRFFNKRRIKVILVIIWILSCAYSLPWIFFSEFTLSPDGKSYCIYAQGTYKLIKIYDTVTFVIFYCLPLMVLAFMYPCMARKLYSHPTLQADSNGEDTRSSILNTVLRCCGRRMSSSEKKWTITMPCRRSTATSTSFSSLEARLSVEQMDSAMTIPRSVTASTMCNTADSRLPEALDESGLLPTDSKSQQPQTDDRSTIPMKNRVERNPRKNEKSTLRTDVEQDTSFSTPKLDIVHSKSRDTDRCTALARRGSLTHHSDAIRPTELNFDRTSQNTCHHHELPDTIAVHPPVATKKSVSSQDSNSSLLSRKSMRKGMRVGKGMDTPLLTPQSAQATHIQPDNHAGRKGDSTIHGRILKMKRKVIRLLMAIV
ncbi:unnamed protein product, partial [Owenia fusiformis]